MKITVEAKELIRALKACIVENKSTIPVLTFVKIEAYGETVKAASTDLDTATIINVAGTVVDAGVGLIPYKQTLSVLAGETGLVTLEHIGGVKGVPCTYWKLMGKVDGNRVEVGRTETKREAEEARIKIAADAGKRVWDYDIDEGDDVVHATNGTATLSVNGCVFTLDSLNIQNFPSLEASEIGDAQPVLRISGETFKRLIERVRFALSKEESRYTINALQLLVRRDNVRLAATDGHRLSVTTAVSENNTDRTEVLVSGDAAAWLKSNMQDESTVTIYSPSNSNVVIYDLGDKVITHRRVGGSFPNVDAVMPKVSEMEHTAHIPKAADFAKTLTRIGKCADTRSGAVKFYVNGKLNVTASSTENGKASADIPAVTNGDGEVTFGANVGHVSEFAAKVGKGGIQLLVKDGQSAMLWTTQVEAGESWDYVLMPMRV